MEHLMRSTATTEEILQGFQTLPKSPNESLFRDLFGSDDSEKESQDHDKLIAETTEQILRDIGISPQHSQKDLSRELFGSDSEEESQEPKPIGPPKLIETQLVARIPPSPRMGKRKAQSPERLVKLIAPLPRAPPPTKGSVQKGPRYSVEESEVLSLFQLVYSEKKKGLLQPSLAAYWTLLFPPPFRKAGRSDSGVRKIYEQHIKGHEKELKTKARNWQQTHPAGYSQLMEHYQKFRFEPGEIPKLKPKLPRPAPKPVSQGCPNGMQPIPAPLKRPPTMAIPWMTKTPVRTPAINTKGSIEVITIFDYPSQNQPTTMNLLDAFGTPGFSGGSTPRTSGSLTQKLGESMYHRERVAVQMYKLQACLKDPKLPLPVDIFPPIPLPSIRNLAGWNTIAEAERDPRMKALQEHLEETAAKTRTAYLTACGTHLEGVFQMLTQNSEAMVKDHMGEKDELIKAAKEEMNRLLALKKEPARRPPNTPPNSEAGNRGPRDQSRNNRANAPKTFRGRGRGNRGF
jgi:hypothetical protein